MSEEMPLAFADGFVERRLHIRYVCTHDAGCELAIDDGTFRFDVCDISTAGVCITSKAAEVRSHFRVGIPVYLVSAGKTVGEVKDVHFSGISGRVVWVRAMVEEGTAKEVSAISIGIEFDEPLQSKLGFLLDLLLDSGFVPDTD